jgi:hypothetical protein
VTGIDTKKIPGWLQYNKKTFSDVWVDAINLLSMSGKNLRKLELSFDNWPVHRPMVWIRNKNGPPLHAFSWTLQIRIFKAISRLRSVTSLRILDACPTPIPAYLAASLDLKVITRTKHPCPYPWHLEKLVERVKRECEIREVPREEFMRSLHTKKRFSSRRQPENLELDKHCGFYYDRYRDVEEAVQFQQELDDLGIKEFSDPGLRYSLLEKLRKDFPELNERERKILGFDHYRDYVRYGDGLEIEVSFS